MIRLFSFFFHSCFVSKTFLRIDSSTRNFGKIYGDFYVT